VRVELVSIQPYFLLLTLRVLSNFSYTQEMKCSLLFSCVTNYNYLIVFPTFWLMTEVLTFFFSSFLWEKLNFVFKTFTFTVDSRPSASSKNVGETSILWSLQETALSSFYKAIGICQKVAIWQKQNHFVWKLFDTCINILSWNMCMYQEDLI